MTMVIFGKRRAAESLVHEPDHPALRFTAADVTGALPYRAEYAVNDAAGSPTWCSQGGADSPSVVCGRPVSSNWSCSAAASGEPPIMRSMAIPPVRTNRTTSSAAKIRKTMLSQVVQFHEMPSAITLAERGAGISPVTPKEDFDEIAGTDHSGVEGARQYQRHPGSVVEPVYVQDRQNHPAQHPHHPGRSR
jgi:hypothetical protein